jgi:hypothetical protein
MESNNIGKQQPTITAPLSEGAARPSQSPPEFFRLPKSGGDPYFGLGRSYYYEGEKQGYWRLIRLRQRGKLRGVTLVPYDAIAAFIRNHGRAEASDRWKKRIRRMARRSFAPGKLSLACFGSKQRTHNSVGNLKSVRTRAPRRSHWR